jgi:membrane-bound lytic murein transglycosylase B
MKIFAKPVTFTICFLCLFIFCMPGNAATRSEKLSKTDVDYLVGTFSSEGFDEDYLIQVFSDSRLCYIPGLVKRNLDNKVSPDNYKRFLEPVAIGMAKRFGRKWRTLLRNASQEFDVDQEVIIAILLVETSLGEYLGNHPVTSTFISIILENQGKRRKKIEESLADDPEMDRCLKRLAIKAQWARKELKALLKMKREHKINIYKLRGSYAGAFGIPQFLPSSYLQFGCDGDKSNTVDLFYVPDAIVSVVNYLKAHGWEHGLSNESNNKVAWHYNHSKVYVETVMQIAKKLQKSAGEKVVKSSPLNSLDKAIDG